MTMSGGKLLVVHDDANTRGAFVDTLESHGYEVSTAENGEVALTIVSEFCPEVVVTDVKMPKVDGLSLLAQLHAVHPEIGVILMTGFGEVEAAVRGMREGAADYLLKPLTSERLLIVVRNTLERMRLRREVHRLQRRLDQSPGFDKH
jgi:two-component system response regulator AtoC